MSSSPPSRPYSEKELKRLYPSNLKLHQVQILLRHGERTPTSSRFEHAGLAPFWPYCSAAKQLFGITANSSPSWSSFQWRRHLETFDSDDSPVVVSGPQGQIEGMCNFGDLTDPGRKSAHALGTWLRHLYVDKLQFLPSTIKDPRTIYLRATRIPRALESLQEAFLGMYPPQFQSECFPPPAILLRAPSDETLNPNNGFCTRFAQLANAFSRRSADRWNKSPEMDYLNTLIGQWMPENSKRVAMDSRPRLSGILDTVNSTLAHGAETKLPKEFYDRKGMAIMNELVIDEWFGGYSESQEYRALGIGSLMGDIVSRMVVSVEKDNKQEFVGVRESAGHLSSMKNQEASIKLGLSGCHDTTIASILVSLGSKLESWPQYTSHIAFELFREEGIPETKISTAKNISNLGHDSGDAMDKMQSNSESSVIARQKLETLSPSERSKLNRYYVRVRYNDRPITVSGCRLPGKHLEGDDSFCSLEAFKAIVDKFTPLNWRQDCWSNLNEPAFPPEAEPAGY